MDRAGRELFHRAILHSGTALSPGAMMYNPLPTTAAVVVGFRRLRPSAARRTAWHNPLPTTEAVALRVNCSVADKHDRSTLRLLHCVKQVPPTLLHCPAPDIDFNHWCRQLLRGIGARASLDQCCPWVGLTHGLGWIGLGRDFSVFVGIGLRWVHYSKNSKNLKGLY